MGITRSILPQKNAILTLPFFGDNYPIFFLDIINQWFIFILTGLPI